MRTAAAFAAAINAMLIAAMALAAAGRTIVREDFEHGLSSRWRSRQLGEVGVNSGSTRVEIDPDGNHFLRITTAGSFQAIGLEQSFAAADYPEMTWRWRVGVMPAHADISRKGGDDAAARLYVVFRHRSLLHLLGGTRALVYLWDSSHPIGAIVPNPYAPGDEKAIVMESGPGRLNQWVSERADLARDFRRAFGEPAGRVQAIVCAGDSDDTHSSSSADFDDITVSARADPPSEKPGP